jgi:hypothetical protein
MIELACYKSSLVLMFISCPLTIPLAIIIIPSGSIHLAPKSPLNPFK